MAVIDDDSEMEFVYQMALENQIKRGLIELMFFSDSARFISWFKQNDPDLILTDINMPHLDGPRMIQLINKSGRRIPTYFVSGHNENEYRKMMLELGVYRFISKPLNLNNVLAHIELDLGLLTANL